MNNLYLQTEIIQLSAYCNIICQLLKNHKSLSICKLMTFSYMIKQNKFFAGNIYTAQTKKDLVLTGISMLSGDFENFCNSTPYIIKSLDILNAKNIIYINDNYVNLTEDDIKIDTIYKEPNFLKNVIEGSKSMTDRQFMKEVIGNV